MKFMKDIEWARNLFDLDTKTEWPNNMTKIWKKKVNCSWAQIMLATTQDPYDAYNTLQTILGGSEHTLNSSFGSATDNNDETKPQKKNDTSLGFIDFVDLMGFIDFVDLVDLIDLIDPIDPIDLIDLIDLIDHGGIVTRRFTTDSL